MSEIGTDKLTEILKIFKSMTCEEYNVLFNSSMTSADEFKVIGNIHENPELLEESK